MAETQLTLNAEEREYLERLLQAALQETRSEVHHTHTPDFRDKVQHEESVVRGLLTKVQSAT